MLVRSGRHREWRKRRYDGKRRIRLPVIGSVKLANMLPYTIPAGDDPDVFYPDKDDGTVFQSIHESEIVREIGYVLNYNGVFPSDAPDVLIDRRSYIYYEMNNPEARVAADFHITIGVDAAAIIADWVFMTWRVGKAPDFVLEVASIPGPFFPPPDPSENELAGKRELYERLGVTEYWRLDPTEGTVVFGEALVGERIVDGSYERLPVTVDADGTWRGRSALLLLDLCWKMEDPWYKTRLRFYNPARREWLLNFSEHEIVRRSLESEVRELRSLLGMTEPSGNGHSRGRYLVGPDESERRRQRAVAELEELRAELHRRQWPPARDQ